MSKSRSLFWALLCLGIVASALWWFQRSGPLDPAAPPNPNGSEAVPPSGLREILSPQSGTSGQSRIPDPAGTVLSPLDRRRSVAPALTPYGLEGRVIDAERHPIQGARIEIQAPTSGLAEISSRPREIWARPDGSFTARFEDPGEAKLTIAAEGYAPQESEIMFSLPGIVQKLFVLTPADSHLEGRVIDAFSRKPVSGAVVEAGYQSVFEGSALQEKMQTRSDRQGKFDLGPLPTGSIRLTAAQAGFFEDVQRLRLARGEIKTTVLELVPADTREFTLKDPDGKPVGGASVLRPDGWTIQADEQGRFRLPLIAELRFLRMTITARGFLAHIVKEPVAQVPDTIVLTPGPALRGQVRDRWGRGIGGARVTVLVPASSQTRIDGQVATDAAGRFSWALSQFEVDGLEIRKDGYVDHAHRFPGRQLPPGPVEIELRQGDAALQVRILREGLSVDRAYLQLRQQEGPDRGTTWNHVLEDGAAETLLSDLSSGVYDVHAMSPEREADGFRIWRGSAEIAIPPNRLASITIHLSPGRRVDIGRIFGNRQIFLDPRVAQSR